MLQISFDVNLKLLTTLHHVFFLFLFIFSCQRLSSFMTLSDFIAHVLENGLARFSLLAELYIC